MPRDGALVGASLERALAVLEKVPPSLSEDLVLLTTEQAADLCGIPVRSLEDRRFRGVGIPYIKLGKLVRYRLSTIRAHLSACEVELSK